MTDHSLKTVQLTSDKRADIDDSFTKPDQLGLVPSWSYSALKIYETCPYRSYIQKVKKILKNKFNCKKLKKKILLNLNAAS